MDACRYASDLTYAEWALLESLVPRRHPAGRRQTYPLRRIVDAIFYLLRTGAQWRLLPHEYRSIPRVVPSSTTMPSGARMAPGST
jgi:transposase